MARVYCKNYTGTGAVNPDENLIIVSFLSKNKPEWKEWIGYSRILDILL